MVTRLTELNLIGMLQVVFILADALPGFSNFYINYILLSSFLQAGHLWQVGDDDSFHMCQITVFSSNATQSRQKSATSKRAHRFQRW